MKRLLATVSLFLLFTTHSYATNIYVNAGVVGGNNDGTSWENAYTSLQDALADPNSSSRQIWVAKGTYKPHASNRTISFNILSGRKLFGGFQGNEPANYDLDLRNFEANETMLSGEIGNQNSITDNTAQVIKTINVGSTVQVDGFTITAANANVGTQTRGAGWYNESTDGASSNPVIKNCKFLNNKSISEGAGLCNLARTGSTASLTITNCIFQGNSFVGLVNYGFGGNASSNVSNCTFEGNSNIGRGGAILNITDATNSTNSSIFISCIFQGNQAYRGGGIANDRRSGSISAIITDCLFSGNLATDKGGAIYNLNSTLSINSATIAANKANNEGGGIYYDNSTNLILYNTVIYGNADSGGLTSLTAGIASPNPVYNVIGSLVQGITTNDFGNIASSIDPKFVSLTDVNTTPTLSGDYGLLPCSPLKNKGVTFFYPALPTGVPVDLNGSSRVFGSTIDIGAYEIQQPENDFNVYVNSTAAKANTGHNWENAFTDIQEALKVKEACPTYDSIWVAKGTYYPTASTDRNAVFNLPEGVAIFGGFEGSESFNFDLKNRDFTKNETILSGNIGDVGSQTDNSKTIIRTESSITRATVVNGFTITDAYDPGLRGGGWFNDSGSPVVEACTFKNNLANEGGAFFSFDGRPLINRCRFEQNEAEVDGGAVYFLNAEGSIFNSTFWQNTCSRNGGAIYTRATSKNIYPEYYFNSFARNYNTLFSLGTNFISSPSYGSSIFGTATGTTFQNSGSGLPFISYSLLEQYTTCPAGSFTCDGNTNLFNVSPKFKSVATGDLSILPCSPAKNVADEFSTSITTDIQGNPRPFTSTDVRKDMGAYEIQARTLSLPASFGSTIRMVGDITTNTYTFADGTVITGGGTGNEANSIFPQTKVEYVAGRNVFLTPGFETTPGAVFTARISNECQQE